MSVLLRREVTIETEMSPDDLADLVTDMIDVDQAEFFKYLAAKFFSWPAHQVQVQLLRISQMLVGDGSRDVREMLTLLLEEMPK